MIDELIKLSDELDQLRLYSAADSVDNIIKKSIMGPTPQRVQELKQQSGTNQMHALLDLLGLVPGIGEGADLANAALYLAEGITPYNLLMAGLSVTSMVPTLGDTIKIVKYGTKIAPEFAVKIANTLLKNQGAIKAAFDRIKNVNAAKNITSSIRGGNLLVKYSDQMWAAVKDWFHKILNAEAKKQIQPEKTKPVQPEQLEEQVFSQLPKF